MGAFLHGLLIFTRLVVGVLMPLGLVYAWLWLFALVGLHHGPIAALLVLFLGLGGLRLAVRSTKRAPLGFYQPWDSGYWILAQRLADHWWQQPARNGVS